MSDKIKNRHRLKQKEIREIQSQLEDSYSYNFIKESTKVETGDFEDIKLLILDNTPCFIFHKNKIIFILTAFKKFQIKNNFVIVDMGAVRFVTSGADVMSPGIVDADKNIREGSPVWICDEKHHKPLAVGISLVDGEQMISEKKGKAIEIIHYVGDKLWKFTAKSL